MPLVLVNGGSLEALSRLLAAWNGQLKAGLYQNDFTPDAASTITSINPANFSGYVGLKNVTGWSAPVLSGVRAFSAAAPLGWVHNGGPSQNWIYGYYVVNLSGVLMWAERVPGPPKGLVTNGNGYQVTPAFTQRSEF